jgi:hypothetical protein
MGTPDPAKDVGSPDRTVREEAGRVCGRSGQNGGIRDASRPTQTITPEGSKPVPGSLTAYLV